MNNEFILAPAHHCPPFVGITHINCPHSIAFPWISIGQCGCDTPLPKFLIQKRKQINDVLYKCQIYYENK